MASSSSVENGSSSDEEPWAKVRKERCNEQQSGSKKKQRRPLTPQQEFANAVAAMAKATARMSLALPGTAGSATPLGALAAAMSAPLQQQQQQQQQEVLESSGVSPEVQDDQGSGCRARRGTAGTFQGRRPPKNPAKLRVFLAEKEIHERGRQKKRPRRRKQSSSSTWPSCKSG